MNNISAALKYLYQYKDRLTYQQYKTIVGQIKSGNIEGAKKGLYKLLKGAD